MTHDDTPIDVFPRLEFTPGPERILHTAATAVDRDTHAAVLAELDVTRAVVDALVGLSRPARLRVLRYLLDRYDPNGGDPS